MSAILSFSYIYNCSVDYLLGKKQEDVAHVYVDVTDLSDEQPKAVDEIVRVMKNKD